MPPATDSKDASPAEDKNPSDLVGEELADSAKIWRVYERVAKEDDERRTKEWDSGLNNLALFAGLFSAVTTAFIIEARHDMEPDYAKLTFLAAKATSHGDQFDEPPFVVPTNARNVTCLWVASLILSLSAALIAIMGKDWIGMYTARPVCNLRQWAEMRTYRLLCVERWYMSGVIAAAPVLLHVSLILFGAGLVLFISSDPFTHHLTLGLSLAAGALYLVTTLSAIVFSASPFKSPATQMLRAALSAFFSYIIIATARPKRDLVGTLLREVNTMVVGRAEESAFVRASVAEAYPQPTLTGHASLLSRLRDYIHRPERNAVPSLPREANAIRVDGFPLLPSYAPHNRELPNLRSMAAVLTAAGRTLVAWVQSLPSSLRIVYQSIAWSRVRLQLHSLASRVRLIPFSDWFLSSTWTDLPVNRRPKLLADALSWVNGASQAPDVFRAIVFALGDLDVGPKVGEHTSPALCTRLRAEIRRTWQHVDFLMLSRYVLADRNTLGNPVLNHLQFRDRFDIAKAPELRCEEGLAAVIVVDPGNILPRDSVRYCPDQVAQPMMLDLLLPHMEKPQRHLADVIILLSNRYRAHLWTTNSFNVRNLEAHLYETLDAAKRDQYATAISVKYGGTAGPIELLTFLCCHDLIDDVTKPAAVELVMHLLERLPRREHRCLAYFGSSYLWDATWEDESFLSLSGLSDSLARSCFHPHEPNSARTLFDDREFDFALARTAAMMLSPQTCPTISDRHWIKFLHGYLCQSPLPSHPDGDEKVDVIRLILESAALVGIVGVAAYYGGNHDVDIGRTAILAAIINHVGHRLCDPATIRNGEQLFAALAHAEGKWYNGETFIWDLGEWLHTTAPEILQRSPSSTAAMREVHDALSTIRPLCEHNQELRAIRDRIGYSGPPVEVIYLCDPYLDIGEFFARAEDPHSQSGV